MLYVSLIYREEAQKIERRRNELMSEHDKILKKVAAVEKDLQSKADELEHVMVEAGQKTQELQELNEMILDNDSKYKRVINEHREVLDKTFAELRDKEQEYHDLLVEIDKLSRQSEEIQEGISRLERECQTKEESLHKFTENLDYSQSEVQRLNENIIVLTEKEAAIVRIYPL